MREYEGKINPDPTKLLCAIRRPFLRIRAHATVGYLNLCIMIQEMRCHQLGSSIVSKRNELAGLRLVTGRHIKIDRDLWTLMINGETVSASVPLQLLEGHYVQNIFTRPGNILDIQTISIERYMEISKTGLSGVKPDKGEK